jgi:hypothetical protein
MQFRIGAKWRCKKMSAEALRFEPIYLWAVDFAELGPACDEATELGHLRSKATAGRSCVLCSKLGRGFPLPVEMRAGRESKRQRGPGNVSGNGESPAEAVGDESEAEAVGDESEESPAAI